MKVFISWSGDRSRSVADLLDEWLQCVIQAVNPWMSSKDIDRGSLWFSEINDQLQNTSIGIICLTQENKEKPWILFESGALAKGLSSTRVCTFLIDLESSDVGNPLAQFNHTYPEKESLWDLVRTLNNSLDNSLKEKVLESVFETYWPQFLKSFNKILKDFPISKETVKRSDDDILLEILATTRSLEKRVRRVENSGLDSNTRHREKGRDRDRDIGPERAMEMIHDLYGKDVSEDSIMDIVGSMGPPEEWVKSRLEEIKN